MLVFVGLRLGRVPLKSHVLLYAHLCTVRKALDGDHRHHIFAWRHVAIGRTLQTVEAILRSA
jgi:hypothetical protein